jgi:hypothetical protein
MLIEERPGWEVECPRCVSKIPYTVLNLSVGVDVYLYCDTCSNFVLREEDRRELVPLLSQSTENDFDAKVGALYERLEKNLPPCECGGRFTLWSNVKCPNCYYEFPYNNGIRNLAARYREPKLVWIQGAIAYRGSLIPSNKLERIIRAA